MNRVLPDAIAAARGGAHESWRHRQRHAVREGVVENWESGNIDMLHAYARMSERHQIAAEDRRARQAWARSREHRPWRLRRRLGLILIAAGVALIEPPAAPSCHHEARY